MITLSSPLYTGYQTALFSILSPRLTTTMKHVTYSSEVHKTGFFIPGPQYTIAYQITAVSSLFRTNHSPPSSNYTRLLGLVLITPLSPLSCIVTPLFSFQQLYRFTQSPLCLVSSHHFLPSSNYTGLLSLVLITPLSPLSCIVTPLSSFQQLYRFTQSCTDHTTFPSVLSCIVTPLSSFQQLYRFTQPCTDHTTLTSVLYRLYHSPPSSNYTGLLSLVLITPLSPLSCIDYTTLLLLATIQVYSALY